MQSLLKIKDFTISLYIGVGLTEQNNKQEIYIDIEIKFKSLPKSIKTDDIQDTECYVYICAQLDQLNGKKFKTIEFLANKSFTILKQRLPLHYINVHVKKRPLINGLQGGVVFSIGEFLIEK